MKIYNKLFSLKKYRLTEENLVALSELTNKIAKENLNDSDLKLLEKFIYFNKQNPYLYQLCANAYSQKNNRKEVEYFCNKAIGLNIIDGGASLYLKAINRIYDNFCSWEAVNCLIELIDNRNKYESQVSGEPEDGIFRRENEYGFTSFFYDLRHPESLGSVHYSLSFCYSFFQMPHEAITNIKKAIEFCPEREDFKAIEEHWKKGNTQHENDK